MRANSTTPECVVVCTWGECFILHLKKISYESQKLGMIHPTFMFYMTFDDNFQQNFISFCALEALSA